MYVWEGLVNKYLEAPLEEDHAAPLEDQDAHLEAEPYWYCSAFLTVRLPSYCTYLLYLPCHRHQPFFLFQTPWNTATANF